MDGEKISQAFRFIHNAILTHGECLEKNAIQQITRHIRTKCTSNMADIVR